MTDDNVVGGITNHRHGPQLPNVIRKQSRHALEVAAITFAQALYPRDAMLSRYLLAVVVCPSVCHKPALYQNG